MYYEKIFKDLPSANTLENVVSCSSDFDIYTKPSFSVSGGTSGTCVNKVIVITAATYSGITTSATTVCPSATTCFSTSTWDIVIKENATTVYSGYSSFWTGTTITERPPNSAVETAIYNAFTTLNYDFSNNGLTFTVRKPYATTALTVSLLVDFNLQLPCTGDCAAFLYTIGSATYPSISSGSTGVWVLDRESGIKDITISPYFNAKNLSSFTGDRETNFWFEIYKYDDRSTTFHSPIRYKSSVYDKNDLINIGVYKGFTNIIGADTLNVDGDYLLKGYFIADVDTDIGSQLGFKINTSQNKVGNENGLYNRTYDTYFVAINKASTPIFSLGIYDNNTSVGSLRVISNVITTANTGTTYYLGSNINSDVLVTLNGDTLSKTSDYTFSSSTLSNNTRNTILVLNAATATGDTLTYVYVTNKEMNRFKNDQIQVTTGVTSGSTGNQGYKTVYYNTTTSKYEIYTELTPVTENDVYVTINGVTLANNIDYYRSTTDSKRIILNGALLTNDLINIYYNSRPNVSGNVYGKKSNIAWFITRAPEKDNGYFVTEVSDDKVFTTITQSAITTYQTGVTDYLSEITLSGTVNTTYYYRVKNIKRYETICGDVIESQAISEVVPIKIINNTTNSY